MSLLSPGSVLHGIVVASHPTNAFDDHGKMRSGGLQVWLQSVASWPDGTRGGLRSGRLRIPRAHQSCHSRSACIYVTEQVSSVERLRI